MPDHIYKTIELTGSSTDGIEEAINGALERASESLHNLRWFQMTELRGEITDNQVAHWQVSLKVGFALDSNAADD
jgi:flavin-binding protein dodecin